MKVGDKCKYRDHGHHVWKEGVIQGIRGPFSARVYIITGTGHYTGELETRTSNYVVKVS